MRALPPPQPIERSHIAMPSILIQTRTFHSFVTTGGATTSQMPPARTSVDATSLSATTEPSGLKNGGLTLAMLEKYNGSHEPIVAK